MPIVANKRSRLEPYFETIIAAADLRSCGIGKVLSRPSAAKPRMFTNVFERPKMRKRIASHRLDRMVRMTTKEPAAEITHIRPARNSIYWEYDDHCQKDMGRVEVPRLSELIWGRWRMQIYKRTS